MTAKVGLCNGYNISRSRYGKSQADVRRKLKKAQEDAQNGVLVPAPNMTVREYLEG